MVQFFLMLFQSTHARSIIAGSIIAMAYTSSTHVCMYTECACMRHINQNPAFMCRHHNKISIRRRIYLFWERQSSGRTTNNRVLSFEAWLYMYVCGHRRVLWMATERKQSAIPIRNGNDDDDGDVSGGMRQIHVTLKPNARNLKLEDIKRKCRVMNIRK